MHAFITRHKVTVVAVLLVCMFAYLGLYAVQRLRATHPPAAARASSLQSVGAGRSILPNAI